MIDYTPALQFAQTGPLIGDGGIVWQCPAAWVIEACHDALRVLPHSVHDAPNDDAIHCALLWHSMAALVAARGIDTRVTFRTWQILAGVFVPDIGETR